MKKVVLAVIINPVGEILCVSRKDDHTDFGLPGGKVEPDDASEEDALVREVKEETGLDIEKGDLSELLSRTRDDKIITTYLALDYDGELNTEEPHALKWGTFEDLIRGRYGEYNLEVLEHFKSNH